MHTPKGNLQLKLQPMDLNLLLQGQQLTRSSTFAQLCNILVSEVWILEGIYQLKDEWVFCCSLKTRLEDQTKTQQLKWL